ncbi:MAG: polyprenyl synthetase family protein [Planctomycetota bacterium]|jgi:geranylgeranyl pyrophosphate synthase
MADSFVTDVSDLIKRRTADLLGCTGGKLDAEPLRPGKMLRTRLAGRLVDGNPDVLKGHPIPAACAAIELIHTASLCHDDVVDNALIRRSVPTLWRAAGQSGAILLGDLLLCGAVELLLETGGGDYLPAFMAKVREVVEAETEHELVWRGQPLDEDTSLRLARGKTGPLFAFVASVCGGDDRGLCAALEEAGYRIGTAYQLADDLLDIVGDEGVVGKTLGTDSAREKSTLSQGQARPDRVICKHVVRLCSSALELLDPYPRQRQAVVDYLTRDLHPVLNRHSGLLLELPA